MTQLANRTIVWLPLGDERVPSSRLRSLAVARQLAQDGISHNVFPPFELNEAPAALFVEKKCGPQTLEIVRALRSHGTRIVYDLCDPIWLQDDVNRQREWDVKAMVGLANRVTVPTIQMKQDLEDKFPDAEAIVIPDVLEFAEDELGLALKAGENECFRIGWTGTSLNMEHIPPVAGVITAVSKKADTIFRLVTQAHQGLITAVPFVKTEYFPWSLETYKGHLSACDCMIIPMAIRETTRTKSSNRLQLCLGLGLPVIASPLPSYVDLMQEHPGLVSFAETPGEWEAAMVDMLDRQYRQACAERGVVFAREYCCFERVLPLWRDVLLGSR
jgi:hypothetical protein